jgi:hypothetical protein
VNDLGSLDLGLELQQTSVTPAAAEGAIAELCDGLKGNQGGSAGDRGRIPIGEG